jgi:hypothetical protein
LKEVLTPEKKELIPKVTRMLSKVSPGTEWIKEMAIYITMNAPQRYKHEIFDTFVLSIEWNGPIPNDKFYELLLIRNLNV